MYVEGRKRGCVYGCVCEKERKKTGLSDQGVGERRPRQKLRVSQRSLARGLLVKTQRGPAGAATPKRLSLACARDEERALTGGDKWWLMASRQKSVVVVERPREDQAGSLGRHRCDVPKGRMGGVCGQAKMPPQFFSGRSTPHLLAARASSSRSSSTVDDTRPDAAEGRSTVPSPRVRGRLDVDAMERKEEQWVCLLRELWLREVKNVKSEAECDEEEKDLGQEGDEGRIRAGRALALLGCYAAGRPPGTIIRQRCHSPNYCPQLFLSHT